MEKPFILFNLRRGVNRIRYHYFYGPLYPYLANIRKTVPITLAIFLGDWLSDGSIGIGAGAYIVLMGVLSAFLTYVIIRLFFTSEQQKNYGAWMGVGAFNSILLLGIYLTFAPLFTPSSSEFIESSPRALLLAFGIILLFMAAATYAVLLRKVGRITIYPNRIVVYDNVFMLDKIKNLTIHCGNGIEDFPERYKEMAEDPDKLVFLTPLHFIDEYDDIEIMHYYVFLEYDDGRTYVIQPMTYRNHFAGNARNAWKEDWRWDGKLKLPPEDWVSHLERKKEHVNA